MSIAEPRPGSRRLIRAALRYRVITLTLLVGVVSLALFLAGAVAAAQWTAGLYAIAVAVGYTVRMLRTLASGGLGVDLLAVVAIVATVAVGEVAAALVVVLMLSGGEALEDYANRRARHELDALLRREPRSAHRFAGDRIEDVPVGDVRVGDILLVRPAEVVPVDGVLLDAAAFDLSSLTGESLPVDRSPGDDILSGSINGAEAVRLRATAVASDSQYQQIVALVAQAAGSRPRVVRLADRFAVPFTVFSLLLAGVAWAVSGDPVRFAEVLVLATPCPLLIAAPVAFIGGMSRAAHSGILVRTGSVFETLARARTVVFDKTGTLTTGRPVLREVRPAPGVDATELLALTASAEQYSSHVLAASVVQAAEQRSIALREVASAEEHATNGVLAEVDGRRVAVGKLAFARSFAPDTPRAEIGPGELAVYVTIDDAYAGVLLEADPPRPNASATLRGLRELGVTDIELLTGDAEETAAHTAAALGISRYRAECLPADKVRRVAEITERPVVMVGDGVNDAPVLARADVGVAMGAKGATAASESADVVLLVDDIGGVVDALAISRRTVRIALQSIWLGIAASVVLMLIAAFGVIPAIVGALLQEAVDLATILAALRAARVPRGVRVPVVTGGAPAQV
ncbi:heavy metal-(Cd/Co/Hg/Pb/Zn)-translocating P-type ATPase [Leifsonia sp. 98AMF]|uniref:heavy metal translocating P-type ATPase n=1 Tax=unclassified Leifsonia TaxID=2663824 RepID=UPI00087B8BF6|nr:MULTISPECIES: heavy metal translocating P-type ATPase [unclassified Leifsonia]SDH62962.1 heavy metal-(Cd/Co/Hg/Pb/Zn)-translocating P-type ATPase [Leifsonia sp. 197AMF]SDI76303.1 heavy metal-(Cd/Co/Hg/Pb/Zn)-translocating P-type ATPase [Leifsonia sp. 466MF]SDK10997.1 heavy metal-(Cd/Co/Hg/Pb/Zn)-translocating P-type ATPase [Leifsonia sp. 157MF]SDN79548.1 heavy metal-(Cd/Co/Hg/Pb/Zn)-translocating P-type ATPase [Leifsonia sp. 509MF]SEN28005.1 heavy metal-(Cd/Co/Hg/Pb/Zn)-translocating P-type